MNIADGPSRTNQPNRWRVFFDRDLPTGRWRAVLLEHLRRDRPTLRVVILTGNADVEVARATLRAGAFDYLCKPFDINVLARVVAAAVALPS